MNFYRILGNLNSLLLGQYLMKSGLSITKRVLIEIQSSDKNLSAKITQMTEQNVSDLNNFELHQGILYKVKMVYEQKAFRLCLPEYLGKEFFSKCIIRRTCH